MVAVVPNRTAVDGVVRAVRPHGADHVDVDLDVLRCEPVAGVPDLLGPNQPTDRPWTVLARRDDLPADLSDDALVGQRLTALATLAGPEVIRLLGGGVALVGPPEGPTLTPDAADDGPTVPDEGVTRS